jgi:hypothetical protein
VESRLDIRQKASRKFNAYNDRDKEIGKQERQERSRDFHDAASEAPARALRVVKDWFSFFHEWLQQCMQPGGIAEIWELGETRPPARFRLLYCKMRLVHEANFLASRHRISRGLLPAAFLRVEVSSEF